MSQVYGGYTWLVTFNTDLGDVGSITADILSMMGTAPVLAVSENVQGVAPSFASLDPYNALPLGSASLTDLSDLSMSVSGLEEGVAYYFRVTASNYIGPGDCPLTCPRPKARTRVHVNSCIWSWVTPRCSSSHCRTSYALVFSKYQVRFMCIYISHRPISGSCTTYWWALRLLQCINVALA